LLEQVQLVVRTLSTQLAYAYFFLMEWSALRS
jgi:hypothetical protein